MKIFGTTIKFYEDINSAEFYIFWGAVLLVFIIILIIGIVIDRKKTQARIKKEEKIEKIVENKPIEENKKDETVATKELEEIENVQRGNENILVAKAVESDNDEVEDFRKAFFKKAAAAEESPKPEVPASEENNSRQLEPPVMIKIPERTIAKSESKEDLATEKISDNVVDTIKQPEPFKEIINNHLPVEPVVVSSQPQESSNDYQALLELNKLSGKYNVDEVELKQFKPVNLSESKKEEQIVQKAPIDILNQPLKMEPIALKSDIGEVAKKIEEDIENNKNIGFTKFEQHQEEDAIISYDELIKNAKKEEVHEPIMVNTTTNKVIDVEPLLDDVEDIDDFLRQLKDLRDNI